MKSGIVLGISLLINTYSVLIQVILKFLSLNFLDIRLTFYNL